MTGVWASLFSGGKDSSFALWRALEEGHPVERLVTVHPGEDSYMYHVPATELAELAAESIGLALVEVAAPDVDPATVTDAGEQGDVEVEPLEAALRELDETLEDGLAGLTAGAIESEYQTSRIEALCDRLEIECFAPLWQRDPVELGRELLAAGFEVTIVQVAAAGLDESWLGRTLDGDGLDELVALRDEYGVHPLGEGGEFETLVTDGPHMDRALEIEATPTWDGTRGHLRIEDAWLEPRD